MSERIINILREKVPGQDVKVVVVPDKSLCGVFCWDKKRKIHVRKPLQPVVGTPDYSTFIEQIRKLPVLRIDSL